MDTGYTVGLNGTIRKTTTGIVSINPVVNTIPENFMISQNYPNPFNPSTKIRFEIPELRFVQLKVYDDLGWQVKTLINAELKQGIYELNFDAATLPSGVYFYKL